MCTINMIGINSMQEDNFDKFVKLAFEADLCGNYKSADKIDSLIKRAQSNPIQNMTRNFINRIRGFGDEGARARRQIRDLGRGPNTIDRMRSQPSYDELLKQLEGDKNISGHNPAVLRSNATFTDRIINALQPSYKQVMQRHTEFPRLYDEWKNTFNSRKSELQKRLGLKDDEFADYLRDNPSVRESLVGPLENELVAMRDAHVSLIDRTINEVCRVHGIERSPGNLNQIKARIGSDRNLRGMLYDNSFTTDSMIEDVLTSGTIPMKAYVGFGPWKRSMSPAVAGLLFFSAGAAGGSAIKSLPDSKSKEKTLPKEQSKSQTVPQNQYSTGTLENELEADRKGTGMYDTPIETIEKYIKRKKQNGSIKPGITKKELYNMALIDLGEHTANNLIQYVMSTYGFKLKSDAKERDFELDLF